MLIARRTHKSFFAVFLAAALPVAAFAQDADKNPMKPDAVYLILMMEPPANHVIEMPSMVKCIEAMRFSPSAKCTRGVMPKMVRDFKALPPQTGQPFLPASGPASGPKPARRR